MEIPIHLSFQSRHQIGISYIETMLSSSSMTFVAILAITALMAIDTFAVRSSSRDSLRLQTQMLAKKITGYVPSGLTPEQYAIIKKKDADNRQKKQETFF